MSVVEPNAIAVYEPSGQFQLDRRADRRGARSIEQLEAVADAAEHSHDASRATSCFLMVSSQSRPQQYQAARASRIFRWSTAWCTRSDLKTGEPLWPGPAVVRNRGIVLVAAGGHSAAGVRGPQDGSRRHRPAAARRFACCASISAPGETVYRNDELAGYVGQPLSHSRRARMRPRWWPSR